MRRFLWLVFLPAGLVAQQPAVSPALPQLLGRVQDTTVSVWLFARPGTSLDALSNRLTAAGARVRVRSRWLHAVSADVPSAALQSLLADRELRRIQPLGRFRMPRATDRPRLLELPPSPTAGADTCPPGGDPVYGPSDMPLRRLHLRPITNRGHRGAGVRVGILDTGFDTQNAAFAAATVRAQHDFVFNDNVVRDEAADQPGAQLHGTAVWSLFAADVVGRLRGIAPDATFLLAKTEDVRTETRVEEDNYVAALEWADSIGVDIISSSLAYLIFDNGFSYTPSDLNGDIAVTTVAVDAAARRGIIVVTAAANEGPAYRSIWTPADADSAMTIGAEDSLGSIAFFSSRGPTADGRLKPDFTAPGVAVCVIWGGQILREAGTSFATPLTAAGVTLMKELFPTLGPIAMRDTLRVFASNRASPDSTFGWGRPDFAASAGVTARLTAISPITSPLATITPTFTWDSGTFSGGGTPVTYRLRIARDSAFATIVLDTVVDSALSYNLTRPLKVGSIYWRVDGRNAASDTASTGRIGPLAVPPWAVLTSLSNPSGTVTDSAQPTFTWDPVPVSSPPGPFTYDLQVQRLSTGLYDFGIAGRQDTSFRIPQPLERNTAYRWILIVHAGSDTSIIRSQGSFLVVDGATPTSTLLYQNFPNPFPAAGRDSTCLWFDIATTGMVELDILDLRGNRVKRFIPGPDFPPILPPGRYGRGTAGGGGICDTRLMWDGRAENGHPLPAGVYLAKLKAPGLLVFKRIVFRGR